MEDEDEDEDLEMEDWDLLDEIAEKVPQCGALSLIRGTAISQKEVLQRQRDGKLEGIVVCMAPYGGASSDFRFFSGEIVWTQDEDHDMSSFGGAIMRFSLPELAAPGPYILVLALDED